MRVSARTGHHWMVRVRFIGDGEEWNVVYCARCGHEMNMNYPPPDDWLDVLTMTKIPPSCDENAVLRVMED